MSIMQKLLLYWCGVTALLRQSFQLDRRLMDGGIQVLFKQK